ncbi:MAG TPA: phage major capsid protein [Polyangia bacterium]|nr:phage major capsid protein [Polyangia bacterium]
MHTAHRQNEEMIEKTIATSDLLTGGLLNPIQQTQFVTLVKKFSVLLPMSRFIRMPRPLLEIDKLWIGEPVTESVDEATDTGNLSRAKFQRIVLRAQKLRSAWNITTEVLQGNIEQNEFEQTIMNTMVERIATDLEDLHINGDTTTAGTTPRDRLLRRLDGWDKQTESAHIVDVKGAAIQKGIWSEMKRRMPKQYKNDPGLRWLVGDAIATDWADVVSDRGTILGDAALQGAEMSPLGTPMIRVPLIPDEAPITITAATRAEIFGSEFGPFEITSANDTIKLKVDALPAAGVVIVLTHGTLNVVEVARQINAALKAAIPTLVNDVAISERENRLKLESPTVGAASSLTLMPVAAASQGYTTLGLLGPAGAADPFPAVDTTTSGAAAGSANTVFEGSFIWFVNPKNFVSGILDGTRIFTEFNKNTDQIETIVYNQVDAQVENVDAVVKTKNLRRRTLVL